MKPGYRLETDSMGDMEVPEFAYYGSQTARAVENFPISGMRFPRRFIRALGLIKKHAAATNAELGTIPAKLADAIQRAAHEVAEGRWDGEFVVDIFQTGSGTSTNMNANEVIANRATEILGGKRGDKTVHPNDHVNRGQSSNDVIPTAIHIAVLCGMVDRLLPALGNLHAALDHKATAFASVLKIGRTHLQDATPLRLGDEFGGYAHQVLHGIGALRRTFPDLSNLALGGTAVGTGINTHPEFARRTIAALAVETGLELREAPNHFEAQGAIDGMVAASGALKRLAAALFKIANDIRWMGSGPRCGLGELKLPATQPGSSIMPGKVNPVMCEMLMQVCVQVIGNDAVVAMSGCSGSFELNTFLPVAAYNLLQSTELMAAGSEVFARRCLEGLEAHRANCEANIEKSLGMATPLAPVIGYDTAAKIAKVACDSGRTVREVALELSGLQKSRVHELLDAELQREE